MLIRPQTCLPLFEDLALRSAVEFRSAALLFKCLSFCRFLCRGSFCCGFIFFIEVLRFLSPSHSINNICINWMIGWRSTLISTGKNKYISNSNELSPPSSSPSQVATIVFASPQISGLAACSKTSLHYLLPCCTEYFLAKKVRKPFYVFDHYFTFFLKLLAAIFYGYTEEKNIRPICWLFFCDWERQISQCFLSLTAFIPSLISDSSAEIACSESALLESSELIASKSGTPALLRPCAENSTFSLSCLCCSRCSSSYPASGTTVELPGWPSRRPAGGHTFGLGSSLGWG
jgi:hypothetical protein